MRIVRSSYAFVASGEWRVHDISEEKVSNFYFGKTTKMRLFDVIIFKIQFRLF